MISVLVALLATLLAIPGSGHAYQRYSEIVRASVASDGSQAEWPLETCAGGNECSYYDGIGTSLSASGRFIAFPSHAVNLADGDTNRVSDIFVRDLRQGSTERISVTSDGLEACCLGSFNANRLSWGPAISGDGHFVAFDSEAVNLVPGDANLGRDVFVHDRRGRTIRVSIASDGTEATYPIDKRFVGSEFPSISKNGRYVAFMSFATNLVSGDTNDLVDIFVHDVKTGQTRRVSVSGKGEQANGASYDPPSISADGRYVAFTSEASNIVPDDTNQLVDVFVHDLATGDTERVSVASDGSEGNLGSQLHDSDQAISADGRFVVFPSLATNLVPNDSGGTCTGGCTDVFVRDRKLGRTERVSVSSTGSEAATGNSGTADVSISTDGRYVIFQSWASDLTEGTDDGGSSCDDPLNLVARGCDSDVFVYDRYTGTTDWVSTTTEGAEGNCGAGYSCPSGDSAINGDGRYVAFISPASNFVDDDTDAYWDVFVRDRGVPLGVGAIPVYHEGGDRWDRTIARFEDDPRDSLGPASLGAELLGASVAIRPQFNDLFLRLDLAWMPRLTSGVGGILGLPTVVYGSHFQVDGGAYEVRISRLDHASTGATFLLFSCSGSKCSRVGSLEGGYGTTGEQVVVAIPLTRIGLANGGRLSDLHFFAQLGTVESSGETLDELDRRIDEG